MKKPGVQALVEQLSAAHPLQSTGGNYKRDFISAAESVYPAEHVEKILQEKLFIPNDSRFKLDRYLQSAAELSVQNDLKQNPSARNFEIDKKIHPPKNVEAFYEAGGAVVSLEVKCAEEKFPDPNSLVLKSAGRVPDFSKKAGVLHELFRDSQLGHVLETDKNMDNAMKDFLLSANAKFSPSSSVNSLNILFVACGNIGNINNWWLTLHGSHELFAVDSYYPKEEFELVDIVILSNLKFLHTEAREHHDWTLKNAFLFPCVNPHGRKSLVGSMVRDGLGVFNHHLYRFYNYVPKNPLAPSSAFLKIGAYYVESLDENEKLRYFPVQPPKKNRTGA